MNNFSFWNDWEKSFQLSFKIISSFILLLLISFLVFELGDFSIFYKWKITGYLENYSFPIFSNHSSLLESTVSTDIPIIFQKAFGSFKLLPSYYAYIYLVFLYMGIAGCMTIGTYLQKIWYLISTGFFILIIAMSGIGQVGFFGFYQQTAIVIAIICFIPISYYFYSINDSMGIAKRFMSFILYFIIVFGAIELTSEYDFPPTALGEIFILACNIGNSHFHFDGWA